MCRFDLVGADLQGCAPERLASAVLQLRVRKSGSNPDNVLQARRRGCN